MGYGTGFGFRDSQHGIGVQVKPGWSKLTVYGVTSEDGGRHWQRLADAPNCAAFQFLPKSDVGLCIMGDGRVFSTKDAGSWTLERSLP